MNKEIAQYRQLILPGYELILDPHMPTLSSQDERTPTLWKWKYSLESAGYTPKQAEGFVFLRWLNLKRFAGNPQDRHPTPTTIHLIDKLIPV